MRTLTTREVLNVPGFKDLFSPARIRLLRTLAEPEEKILPEKVRAEAWLKFIARVRAYAEKAIQAGKITEDDVSMLALSLWDTALTAEQLIIIESGIYRLIDAISHGSSSYKFISWSTLHRLLALFHFHKETIAKYMPGEDDLRYTIEYQQALERIRGAITYSQLPLHTHGYRPAPSQSYTALIPSITRWHAKKIQYKENGTIAANDIKAIHDIADGLIIRPLLGKEYLPTHDERETAMIERSKEWQLRQDDPSALVDPRRTILQREVAPDTIARLYVLLASMRQELCDRKEQEHSPQLVSRYPTIKTSLLQLGVDELDETLHHFDLIC